MVGVRSSRIVAVVAAAASLWLLAGCAPAPAPVPLTATQRVARLHAGFDSYWKTIADEYPDAVRPEVSIVQIQAGANLAQLLRSCLRSAGVTGMSVSSDGTIGVDRATTHPSVQELERQEIALYTCSVRYPRRDLYDSFLSDSQLGALWEYYVGFLEPCLEFSGHAVSVAPGRAAFISGYYEGVRWNPYNGISFASNRLGDRDILRRCPPRPRWLG